MLVLAQFDVVKMRYPKDDPRMDGFFRSAPHVNNLAENHPGYIWRERDDEPELAEKLFGPGHLYTISTWNNFQCLSDFLYRSPHIAFIKAGHAWFDRMAGPHVVLWWIDSGHRPTLQEAYEKLTLLKEKGPGSDAFDLNHVFLPRDMTIYMGGI